MNDHDLMERIRQTVSHSYVALDDSGYSGAFVHEREQQRSQLPAPLSEEIGQRLPNAVVSQLWNDCDANWNQPPDFTAVFDALHLLGWMVWTWKDAQSFNGFQTRTLDLLQKRFEVHHRLFDRYDGEIRRQGENFKDARVYIVLAVVLLLRFCGERNYNDLNTALKLHDVLLKAGWELDTVCKRWLSLSLWLESDALRREDAA
jgi:hypothetical protein